MSIKKKMKLCMYRMENRPRQVRENQQEADSVQKMLPFLHKAEDMQTYCL